MRTTINIPDVLYRAVRSRTAAEGSTLRNITIALYGDWMQRADWHPQLRTETVFTDYEPKAKPKRHLKCIGIARKGANLNVSHGYKTLSCEKDFRKLDFTEVIT